MPPETLDFRDQVGEVGGQLPPPGAAGPHPGSANVVDEKSGHAGRTADLMDRSHEILDEDAFRRLLAMEAERAIRYRDFFSFCLVKADTREPGTDDSDALRRAIARKIAESLRSTDIVGNVRGGAGFLLLHTTSPDAVRVAERIRTLIEQVAFRGVPGELPRRITLSIGEVSFPRDGATDRALLSRAEANLQEASRQGGNRVVATDEGRDEVSPRV